MKIAFFGTSDRSQPILKSLNNNFDLEFCITKKGSGVEAWCKENKIKITQKVTPDIDLGVVADYSQIISGDVINTPKYKIINIHFSLLPELRGASPIQHAILQGLNGTGVSYFVMSEKMDTGDIIYQFEHPLDGTETSGELYEILFEKAANHLPQVISDYTSGKLIPQPQDHSKATYCYSKTHPKSTLIHKDDALIDWKDSAKYIERQVRAFDPWPIAWAYLKDLPVALKDHINPDLKVKIHKVEVKNGKLEIKELQVEGKNIIDWESFENGYTKK
ncbi:methionyl-tRNA formyltransferase [Patescibacteria group bacterium]